MNDLITAATSGLFVEIGKVIQHMKAQASRIAELERQQRNVFDLMCEWKIGRKTGDELADALFSSFASTPAIGAAQSAPQAADTDKVREAWAKDAETWGGALNEAACVFLEVCPEKSTMLFNHVKPALRAAILKYAEKVAATVASQAPVREVPGWISIDDYLPAYGTEVLVFQPEKECKVTALARFTSNVWDYYWDAAHIGKGRMTRPASVTHWLPLPAAPVQKGE